MAILMTSKKKWKSPIETTVNKANKKPYFNKTWIEKNKDRR